jgi:deoxyribonuclease V
LADSPLQTREATNVKALRLHRWDVTPAKAREIQLGLRHLVERNDRLPRLRRVAGADVALELAEPGGWRRGHGRAFAGVVLYRFPEMEELERVSAVRPLRFPYVPGLLSFREIPALLAAFERLRHEPDLIFCDGQGYAHPRRFGIACHLGLLLDRPTIGVAKSVLVGEYREPAATAGRSAPLLDGKSGEVIGAALRTRARARPVFVSQGHRISLDRAIELTLAVSDGYRLPRPIRDADHWVGTARRGVLSGAQCRPKRAHGRPHGCGSALNLGGQPAGNNG